MKLKKCIFESRLSGRPLELKRCIFKRTRTAQVHSLLKYGVMKFDELSPFDPKKGDAVFILNDAIVHNEAEYAAGQRVVFCHLNLNGIVV